MRVAVALPLVAVAGAVLLAAELAIGGRLGIVHTMLDGFEGAQVGKDSFEIVIGHVPGDHRRHGRTQVAGLNEAGAHGLEKKGFVIIRNTRGIGSEVGGGGAAPRTGTRESAGKVHAG